MMLHERNSAMSHFNAKDSKKCQKEGKRQRNYDGIAKERREIGRGTFNI